MRYSDGKGGFFELNPFPGCNQLVVSNHSFIPKERRGKGEGHVIHAQRLGIIADLGYDYVLCTIKSDNLPQARILDKAGWDYLDSFHSRETEACIQIYGRVIPH